MSALDRFVAGWKNGPSGAWTGTKTTDEGTTRYRVQTHVSARKPPSVGKPWAGVDTGATGTGISGAYKTTYDPGVIGRSRVIGQRFTPAGDGQGQGGVKRGTSSTEGGRPLFEDTSGEQEYLPPRGMGLRAGQMARQGETQMRLEPHPDNVAFLQNTYDREPQQQGIEPRPLSANDPFTHGAYQFSDASEPAESEPAAPAAEAYEAPRGGMGSRSTLSQRQFQDHVGVVEHNIEEMGG